MSFHNQNIQIPFPGAPQFFDEDGSSTPGSWAHYSTTYTPIDSITPITTNPSRKRSRDETAFTEDGENSYFSFPSVTDMMIPAPIPEEPIYGEGMTFISPTSGRPLPAESQTGTWFEEQELSKIPEVEVATAEDTQRQRPVLPVGRKSIRLSQSSIRAHPQPAPTNGTVPVSPPKSSLDRPEVDEATIALGIGWTKMSSEDPDLQAAARGWAKYIDNHFRDIHGAEILLKSRSLNAYLVHSQEGFYLFGEDLLEGRLVSTTWHGCLQNLRAVPMGFDGYGVLRAEDTPGPDTQPQKNEILVNWSDYDHLNNQLRAVGAAAGGMELD